MKISLTSDRHRFRLAKAYDTEAKANGRGSEGFLEGAGFVRMVVISEDNYGENKRRKLY